MSWQLFFGSFRKHVWQLSRSLKDLCISILVVVNPKYWLWQSLLHFHGCTHAPISGLWKITFHWYRPVSHVSDCKLSLRERNSGRLLAAPTHPKIKTSFNLFIYSTIPFHFFKQKRKYFALCKRMNRTCIYFSSPSVGSHALEKLYRFLRFLNKIFIYDF